MFGIKATFYYYPRTFNAPSDGFLRNDETGNILKFKTFQYALDYLEDRFGKMSLVKGKATFSKAGKYVLHYGEYERPIFTISKMPK